MRWLIIILVVTILLLPLGCGGKGIEEPTTGGLAVDNKKLDIADQVSFEIVDLLSIMDLGRIFSDISLVFLTAEQGWVDFDYLFLETSMVEGKKAQHVRFAESDRVFGFQGGLWITERAGFFLEVIEVTADSVKEEALEHSELVFLLLGGLLRTTIDLELDWPGFEIANTGKETRDFGAGAIMTEVFEMRDPSGHHRLSLEYAEIDGRKFLVRLEDSMVPHGSYTITRLIPRGYNIDYQPQLAVSSAGASSVAITSTTGHGGTTDYTLFLIPFNLPVQLQAPEYVGSGETRKRFTNWSGDLTSTQHSLTFDPLNYLDLTNEKMTVSLTANYEADPELVLNRYHLKVFSKGATNVSIAGKTGHGGTTGYELSGLASGTQVSLEAPQYVGAGAERKRFDAWSGAVADKNREINITMNADHTLTANYVDAPEVITHNLRVNSAGAAKVPIASASGHGGTTDYQLPGLASTARVHLEAPQYVGAGAERKRWVWKKLIGARNWDHLGK